MTGRFARIARRIGGLAALAAAAAVAGPVGAAQPTADAMADAAVPEVLSPADRERYRRIFALQKEGEWGAADKLVARLGNRILIGHVQAQRYLHPTRYRSKYRELAAWLERHADLPDARRIHRLALRRKPARARAPRRPARAGPVAVVGPAIVENAGYRPARRAERRAIRHVRSLVHRQRLTVATRWIRDNRGSLGASGSELARALVASGWFFYGNAAKAYGMAHGVAHGRIGDRLPYSHWIAGLSAFRLGRHESAMEHFSAVARSGLLGTWDRTAGAFWAARAAVRGGRPEEAGRFLRLAAAAPRTFYGILARRWLGEKPLLDRERPSLTQARLERALSIPAGRRAIALVEAGNRARADLDLRQFVSGRDPELAAALLALADRLSLPATAFRTASVLDGGPGGAPAAALYPVPAWKPSVGFKVDPALIYAFMRQESAFNTRAVSHAGARGLMQLMPATAGFISGRRFQGHRRHMLYEPTLNMTLGQKYLLYLLEDRNIGGDVLLAAAAYNGGPGNLRRWRRHARKVRATDPLMFIESMPSRETRIFVERVLSNLWMYRERLGEPAPTLDALAAGERPIYVVANGT